MSSKQSRWLDAIVVLAASAALAALWLVNVWPDWTANIPARLGDNVSFVWNTWWAGHWLRDGGSPFHTAFLFAPWGTSLVLHTHTLLPSLVAATLPGHSVIAATNVLVLVHLTLNFVCAYALAAQITRSRLSAAVAALAFGWSPYVAAHLSGHFNLIAAWVLPLFMLLLLKALEDGRARIQILLGIAAGAIAYVDYYYVVFAIGLAMVVLAQRTITVSYVRHPLYRWQRGLLVVIAALLAIDLLVVFMVLLGGGRTLTVGGFGVSVRGIENPMAAMGLLVMLAAAVMFAPRTHAQIDLRTLKAALKRLAIPTVIGALLVAPLALAIVSLWRSGGYVTQAYLWRSAPAGIDAGTLVLGNPAGALWRGVSADIYQRLHIEAIERAAWLGPGVIALCIAAVRLRRTDAGVRLWMAVVAAFLMWALGPRLEMFGRDFHVYLPEVLLRYVPLAANARMPGRAMVVVYLAAAMLAALGMDALLARGRRGLAWTLAVLVVLDFLPAAAPAYRTDRPTVYDTLAAQPITGAVCELPLGLRDGFGEIGRLDMRVLYYQTIHQRPITGGFVARLDPRLVRAYEDDPVLGVLLRLSGGGTLAAEHPLAPGRAGDALLALGIRFVVLNEDVAPSDLRRYVSSGLPLHELGRDGRRVLYELSNAPVATGGSPSR